MNDDGNHAEDFLSDEPLDSLGPVNQPLDVPSGPLPVRENCWMVGHRNPSSLLQCNTYVRSFEKGSSPIHVCVDPGSQFDYAVIESNIGQLIGDVGELHSFSLNHQDPDVMGNAGYLCEANPNISVMVTEDVWRLAQHMLIKPARVHFANVARSEMTIIGDYHRWQLVPTPFCHFRGAMAFYDPELRTLFTGDLFGGLNQLSRVHLEAREDDWIGIAQFHQIYMPTREALRYAIRQIKALDPAVEIIAPQHGHVITGDLVPVFMEKMYDLLVGHDLLAIELDGTYLEGYRDVIAQVVNRAAETMGREEALARLRSPDPADGLETMLRVEGDDVTVEREGYVAVVKVISRLSHRESLQFVNALRSEVLGVCSELGIPIPPVGAGVEESSSPDTVGPDGIQTHAWWLK
jgi:glyoxylase-like metal-dependent hydrolase (beta-lactamase superfamily II)